MDAIETAVAEYDDDITGFCEGLEARDDRVGGGFVESGFSCGSDVGDDALGVEAFGWRELIQPGDLGYEDSIGLGKGGGEVVLKDGAAGGVRTRFEEGPQANGSEFFPEARKSFADGCGVVAEIIDDGDAIHGAADFLATADALE